MLIPFRKHFAKCQEAYRKDVERAFGVLQARFAIVKNPGRLWNHHDLWTIMISAVILHNLIIEDERDTSVENVFDYHIPNTQAEDPQRTASSGQDMDAFLLR